MGSENRARLAFAGLLLATLLAFSQLFDRGPYLGPAMLGAVLATALALGARRAGLSSAATLATCGAGLLWYLSMVFQLRRLFYGLPTPGALAALGASISHALQASNIDFAPVPPRSGYVILVAAAVWAGAALGEVATFRWRQPLAASVIPISLFAIVMVVGTGQGTWLFLAMFLGALFTFWGVENSHRLRSWGQWVSAFSQGEASLPSPTASVARRMAASCVAAAVVAPLILPGIEEGLLAWRTGTAAGGIAAGGSSGVSLLVSLAPTLTDRSTEALFTVEANLASYWRLTSLANFDGRDWSPARRDSVPLAPDTDISAYQFPLPIPRSRLAKVEQRFEITGLATDVLPAATHAAAVRLDDEDARYEGLAVDTGTGEIRFAPRLTRGFSYEVDSLAPKVTFQALRRAEVGDPGPAYTALPDGISEEVGNLARRWTEDQSAPFERLVAIQNRLRTFDYSLEVTPEDSADYLTRFLTETRRGYCQQFATAFAVLARVLGYPTRVSVGFLPGAPTGRGPGEYIVRGTDAHAWPEVYFRDYGWVAFEPTPRSSAEQPTYTLPAFNAIVGGPQGALSPDPGTTRLARVQDQGRAGARGLTGVTGQASGGVNRNPAWLRAFNRLAGALALLLGLFLVAVPLIKEWRIVRDYRRADSPGGAAVAAFSHFQSEAADLAVPRRRSESGLAYATRLVGARRASRREALALAGIYEAAEYSPRGVTGDQAREARLLAGRLRRALWASATWWQRLERLFSPAGLRARRG